MSETWTGAPHQALLDEPIVPNPIMHITSRRVMLPLLSSFLLQGRWIPLSMVPMVLELELDDYDAAFDLTGNNWDVIRPTLLADVCTMDMALQNSFAKHLLDGRSLPYNFNGLYSLKATFTDATQFSLPINRGFARLSTLYLSFITAGQKESSYFYHPLEGVAVPNDALDFFKYNMTFGSDRYPAFDVECVQEQYYRRRIASHLHTGTDSFSISSKEFRSDSAVFAMNLEKAPGAHGRTTRTSDDNDHSLEDRTIRLLLRGRDNDGTSSRDCAC